MRKDAFKRISGILARYRRHRAWRRVVRALACVVVFCTTYALILPAITLEKKPACGLEEHTHTEDCYAQITELEKRVPVCTLESLNLHRHTEDCQEVGCGYADFVAHKHDDRCYEENGQLWCPIPEKEAHTHDESCYTLPEAHTHGEDCYQKEKSELICTVPAGEVTHTHSQEAGCYEETKELTCGLAESDGHTHSDACKNENGELTCGLEETEGHQHGEGCYTPGEKLICTVSDQPHQHVGTCYDWKSVLTCAASAETAGEPVLTCEKEEIRLHEHTEDCFETDDEGNTYLICGEVQILEHIHTDACFKTEGKKVDIKSRTCGMKEGQGAHAHMESCYDEEKNLICGEGHHHTARCYGEWLLTCGKEEHTHTEACMVDVETEEDWKKTLPEELSGDWREDLLAVAESQLDYAEARPDLQLGEEPRRVTRYGAWYGQPEGEWNSLFAMFCLHYAEIPEESLPQDSDISAWVEKLAGRTEGFEQFQLYHSEEDYTPVPGDLVFFGLDEDEAADRVGIVTKYTPSSVGSGLARSSSAEQTTVILETIEGDVSGQVAERKYPMDGVRILGYAQLPEQPIVEPVEPILICGKEEHTHTELCTSPSPEGTGLVIICGKEEHTHTEDCCAPLLREYRYEDETVSVTVVLPKDSQVPKDASLRVTPITQSEDRYSILERQAHAAANGEVRQLVLYDLSFYTQAGEYLPVEESAAVTITFKQAVLSGEQVEVLHYGEDSDPVALEDVEVQRGENEALSGLRFKTDGFSVFGVMTTQAAGDSVRAASTSVTLYPGQVFTVDEIYSNDIKSNTPNVVEISVDPYPEILKTGSGDDDYTYPGARKPVSDAEYTFVEANGKYTAKHGDLYFNLSGARSGCFSSTTAEEFSILDKDSTLIPGKDVAQIPDGRFALSAGGPSANTGDYRCLFFHGTTENAHTRLGFEMREEQYNLWGCNLVLFRKAEDGETESPEIPGYVQVTAKEQIVSGKQYLIAGKARSDVEGDYYVLYPNASAVNRYQHTAKVSPYALTLTANSITVPGNIRVTNITAGKQSWRVTVTDLLQVETGRTVSVQLPADAEVSIADPSKATVAIADGLATVTGVAEGETTATVTVNGKTYTWKIRVTAHTTFQLTYHNGENDPVITFHLRDKKTGEKLASKKLRDYDGVSNTQYRLMEEGATLPTEDDQHKNIVIPRIEGYRFLEARYSHGGELSKITGVATNGYQDGQIDASGHVLLFYDAANPSQALGVDSGVNAMDVYLEYEAIPLTTTVSPSGTSINLFDYWVREENEGQATGDVAEGINEGHPLHFTTSADRTIPMNIWTGGIKVLQGIVQNTLGDDGYPRLSGALQKDGDGNTESLAYLFDPAYTGPSADYRRAYRNVDGLLQLNDEGYYYYDCTKNYAEYDETLNRFNLYPSWAVYHDNSHTYGQFFPFDSYATVSQTTPVPGANDPGKLNHYFGMTMSTRFVQQHGGHTGPNSDVPMTFDFSGDDDVWIFIDGVLTADLGGIHDAASVDIDFAAGTVVINKESSGDPKIEKTFSQIFAGTNVDLTDDGIFPDNSYHTLKFYYLERGGVASNLHLKFNLVTFPASGITKVDQVGDPIPGAEFSLYRTNADYSMNGAELVCSGTTGTDGEFVFVDGEGQPLVLQELFKGQDKGNTEPNITYPYYVLQETRVPVGYRSTGTDIHLEIKESSGSGAASAKSYVMICTNTRDSGAFASPSLQVTASQELVLLNGTHIRPGETQGTLFGLVLKYIGTGEKNLELEDNWSPIFGSAAEGYTIVDRTRYPKIKDAIEFAVANIGHQNDFHLSSNGSFQALIEDLPGNIASYNFMAGNTNDADVQYVVAYYWRDAGGNVTRVQDYTTSGGTYYFTRVFGTDIQVPNMRNRVAVQKLDEDNVTPVNGAAFGMYRVNEIEGKQYYIAENDLKLFLEPDTDGDNVGQAWVQGSPGTKGTYTVDHEGESLGTIAVSIGGTAYTIQPFQVKTTVGEAQNNYREDGIAEFDKIVSGQYLIRELTAPPGYKLNYHPVMVLVTDNAIYANAGDETDGIAVSRGPGYLAGNLHYYATIGQIENTLCWVYTQMKVSDESTSFADISPSSYANWKWIQTRRDDAYGPTALGPTEDRTKALTAYLKYSTDKTSANDAESSARFSYAVDEDLNAGKRPTTASKNVGHYRRLYTKTGWSYLEVLQDYDYGKNTPPKDPNANYEDWKYLPGTQTPDDLSNLFSRSIYVHVTDPRACNLEISKTVAPRDGETVDPNAAFAFTVNLKDKDGTPMRELEYKVYSVEADGTRTPVTVTGADGTETPLVGKISDGGKITLKHDQVAVLKDIPFGTYSVTETEDTDYSTTYIRDKGLPVLTRDEMDESGAAIQVPIAGQSSGEGCTVSGTLYWKLENGNLKNTSTADFINKPLPDLTIVKYKTGNPTVLLSGAEFTLCKVDETGDPTEYYVNQDGVTTWTKDPGGATVLITGDREPDLGKVTLRRIPDGRYKLTETSAPPGYHLPESPITLTVKDGKFVGGKMGSVPLTANGTAPITEEAPSGTVYISNNTGAKLPSTGGMGTGMFYILGGLLTAGAGLLIMKRKRMAC